VAKQKIPRRTGNWTAIKLEYLDNYLQAYVTATKRAGGTYYIDAFAGCGECTLRKTGRVVEGSAWRALKAVPPFTCYYFIEKDEGSAAYLREAILAKGIENAHVYTGDCNTVIPNTVLHGIPTDRPSFAFLDPSGLQLHWQTVAALAAHRKGLKMELLILYPYDMVIARWLRTPNVFPALTRFYGDEGWMIEAQRSFELKETPDQRRARFVELYRSKLLGLQYEHVEVFGLFYSGQRPLYHVVFASDSEVGLRIMRDVWRKPRFIPGELGYRPMRRPLS